MRAFGVAMQQMPVPIPVVSVDRFTLVCKAGDLFDLQWHTRGETPVCPFGPHGNQPIYSTGILERALATGYDVWVVMTRSRLERYDAWWSEKLPAGHIIFPPMGESVTRSEAEFEPWVQLAVALQLPQYFIPEDTKELKSSRQVDQMAERWIRDRFKDPVAIRDWLAACYVSFASDPPHTSTWRSR